MLGAATLFLAAHLASLPPALEDLDSMNFALGVRDFDVASHQPHPPGYPVFTALAKISTPAARLLGVDAPEARGLAVWSAIGGAVLVVAVFVFAAAVLRSAEQGVLASILTAACPLLWFNALRPMSDVAGLAAAFVSLAALAAAGQAESGWDRRRRRLLLAGAFAAGLAAGIRSQMAMLTLPYLGFLLAGFAVPARDRLAAAAATAAGMLVWAIPLLAASGGPEAYLRALGSQAGEDFTGVVMLSTHPTPRVAATAILNTFVLPWDAPALGGILLSLSAAGFLLCVLRDARTALVLLVVFGPYLAFHLLFQETLTTRYSLPLVPLVAMLAAVLLAAARQPATVLATAAIVLACLGHALPAGQAFGRTSSPIVAALSEMQAAAPTAGDPLVGMHRRVWSESRRARPWVGPLPGRLLDTPRDYEVFQVVQAWRENPDRPLWFVADPRRTDLALIDDARRRSRRYRWPFDERVYLGGARPEEIDWHVYDRPGWFLEQGWALTPEIAGIAERDGWGPHRRPSVGWIRRRPGAALLMIGGRHLGTDTDPAVRVTLALDGGAVAAFETGPGFFLRFIPIPEGALSGAGLLARLTVSAAATEPGPTPRVALEQFNVQGPEVVQFGYAEGWHEPEFNPATARSWRWMSEAAVLRVHHAGRDVAVAISGESPRRYFAEAPTIRVEAAGRTLAEVRPEEDFALEVRVPAALLTAADGRVVLRSSSWFVPEATGGSADRRRLATRIYEVEVRGLVP